MDIEYKVNATVSVAAFIDLLGRCALGARRPVEDPVCMAGMVENSNLMVSAWAGDALVGIARSVTDFHYACYLSDLAVDEAYQGCGVGRKLQVMTQEALGPRCKLILIASPAAQSYYEHIGFESSPRCWVLARSQSIGG